jgi:biotin carboxyl carrier protein
MKPGTPSVRYFVTVRGQEHVVDLAENTDGFEVRLNGQSVDADLIHLHGSSLHSLLLDGHSRELVLERDGDKTFVSLDGERIEVRVQDEVSRALSAFAGVETSGASEILAPMPGVVIDVPVAPGDEIEAGQAVVVVEAMKMQNELTAETEGIVESVQVAPGDTVNGGDVLVVLKAKESS